MTVKSANMLERLNTLLASKQGKPGFFLRITLLGLLLDQASKQLAEHLLDFHQPVVIFSWFNLNLAYNPGVAFSFLADQDGWQRWFFMALSSIISLILFFWIKKEIYRNALLALGLSLILAGALGNLIDRTLFGHVIDFIQVHYRHYYWPTFNIADSVIFIGAALLILDGFIAKDHK